MPKPSVRASAIRDSLEHLDVFSSGAQAKVLARIPEQSRKVIHETARTGYVPIEHDHYVLDAIVEQLGRERAVEFWAGVAQDLADRPLLRTFVSGMLRVVQISAARVVTLIITGWPLIYRDFCTPREVTSEDGHATLRFDNISPEVRRFPNYLLPWRGLSVGCARIAKLDAQIRFQSAADMSWAEATFVT